MVPGICILRWRIVRAAVDPQSILLIPSIVPAKGFHCKLPGQWEIRNVIIVEKRPCGLIVVHRDAVHDNIVVHSADRNGSPVRGPAGISNIGGVNAAAVNGEGPGGPVPIRFHTQEAAQVVRHGKVCDIPIQQQRVLGGAVVDQLPVYCDWAGGLCSSQSGRLRLGRQAQQQSDAQDDGISAR